MGRRSCFFTDGPTTFTARSMSRRCSRHRGTGSSSRTCAATARPGSCPTTPSQRAAVRGRPRRHRPDGRAAWRAEPGKPTGGGPRAGQRRGDQCLPGAARSFPGGHQPVGARDVFPVPPDRPVARLRLQQLRRVSRRRGVPGAANAVPVLNRHDGVCRGFDRPSPSASRSADRLPDWRRRDRAARWPSPGSRTRPISPSESAACCPAAR
jgi:hypothetical protein